MKETFLEPRNWARFLKRSPSPQPHSPGRRAVLESMRPQSPKTKQTWDFQFAEAILRVTSSRRPQRSSCIERGPCPTRRQISPMLSPWKGTDVHDLDIYISGKISRFHCGTRCLHTVWLEADSVVIVDYKDRGRMADWCRCSGVLGKLIFKSWVEAPLEHLEGAWSL